MIKRFRLVAYLEGISFLALLGIAMPLKYVYGNPYPVKFVGWAHGVLFIAYVAMLSSLSTEKNWPMKTKILGLIAGVLPFGTFIFDKKCVTDQSE